MSDDEERVWGIWGGRGPGGWCSFDVTKGGDRLGFGYIGTYREAQIGVAQFVEEQSGYFVESGCRSAYEVRRIDPLLRPAAVNRPATDAQKHFMELIHRNIGSESDLFSRTHTSVVRSVYDNGWVFSIPCGKGDATAMVTAAGREAIRLRVEKGVKK